MKEALWTRRHAAKALRCSLTTVRALERAGELVPLLVDGVHKFQPADVEALAQRRGRPELEPHEVERPKRAKLELTPDVVEALIGLGCGDERGELSGRSLVLTVRRLRERLRHLRRTADTSSSSRGAEPIDTPRA